MRVFIHFSIYDHNLLEPNAANHHPVWQPIADFKKLDENRSVLAGLVIGLANIKALDPLPRQHCDNIIHSIFISIGAKPLPDRVDGVSPTM